MAAATIIMEMWRTMGGNSLKKQSLAAISSVCYQPVFPRSHSLQFTLVIQAMLDSIGGDLHRKGDSLLHVDHITSQFNFKATQAGNTV
jgi:hypothetical protein